MNFETSSNRSFLTRFYLTRKSGRLYSVNKTLSISVSDQIMDTRFNVLGFAANPSWNAFKNIGKSYQNGENCTDTTLRLDTAVSPVPFPGTLKGIKRKRGIFDGSLGLSLDSSLNLRLGHSSSSSDNSKGSSATACTSVSSAKETEESSSTDLELDFTLHLGYGKTKEPMYPAVKATCTSLPEVDLGLTLSGGATESCLLQNVINNEDTISSHGIYSSVKLAETSHGFSESIITTPKSSVTCTSGITQQQQRSNNTKQCQFTGCTKGARGASGLCIAHGGGRRCQRTGCHKGAEGRTAFCKAHGGGRRCEFLGCVKSAEGRTDYCIAHGGGRRCAHDGCARAARGKSGLCIRHGGGKRCQKENCTKSAEGLSGLCISHGGGRRCQYPECPKGAQGSTMFCKAHGGGKRCIYNGCNKGAEGSTPYCKGHGGGKRCLYEGGGLCPKSVHGGTLYCVAHGGGKRCTVQECTKSARGRTDYCVRHGGGKRCKFEGCGKSAQGSTDFCKAHGGGKRCCWGQSGSLFGQGHDPCNAFARAKSAFCASHGALVQDKRVHGGHASLGALMQDSKLSKAEETTKRLVVIPSENMNVDVMLMDDGFISSGNVLGSRSGAGPSAVTIPEGRVHGGILMAVLNGNSATSLNMIRDGNGNGNVNPSKVTETWIHQNWM